MSHVGPHAELFGGLHAAMPHQVCLMASDVVHFQKTNKQKTLHAVLQDGAKDMTERTGDAGFSCLLQVADDLQLLEYFLQQCEVSWVYIRYTM